jgi:hypothetical protein
MSKLYKQSPVIEVFQETERGDILRLKRKMVYEWRGVTITVPAGFECDGASVPRFLWDSVSPQIDPRTLAGSIAHDFIYRRHPAGWTRFDADEMFYDIIREDGLSWWKSQKAYFGVRLFGGNAWKTKGGTANVDRQGA